jgi:peptidyl-prolyl cis-trans isomerase A (cyclophilin A)
MSNPAPSTEVAVLKTSLGEMTIAFWPDVAPKTVENFKKLAREGFYDGTAFHRIIKGFMIQGGDAMKNGMGEAGYVIPDEVWEDANHDRPGLLCMANRGANTNSAQFFITDEAAFHLDGGYTIFGECGPVETIHKIASVEVVRDKPTTVPVIKKVTVSRK